MKKLSKYALLTLSALSAYSLAAPNVLATDPPAKTEPQKQEAEASEECDEECCSEDSEGEAKTCCKDKTAAGEEACCEGEECDGEACAKTEEPKSHAVSINTSTDSSDDEGDDDEGDDNKESKKKVSKSVRVHVVGAEDDADKVIEKIKEQLGNAELPEGTIEKIIESVRESMKHDTKEDGKPKVMKFEFQMDGNEENGKGEKTMTWKSNGGQAKSKIFIVGEGGKAEPVEMGEGNAVFMFDGDKMLLNKMELGDALNAEKLAALLAEKGMDEEAIKAATKALEESKGAIKDSMKMAWSKVAKGHAGLGDANARIVIGNRLGNVDDSSNNKYVLGVALNNNVNMTSENSEEKTESTISVSEVFEDSPAKKAGLKEGDVIVKVNGESLTDISVLQDAVQAAGQDKKSVTISVLRDGEETTAEVSPALQDDVAKDLPEGLALRLRALGNIDEAFEVIGKDGVKELKLRALANGVVLADEDVQAKLGNDSGARIMMKHLDMDGLKEDIDSLKKDIAEIKEMLKELTDK